MWCCSYVLFCSKKLPSWYTKPTIGKMLLEHFQLPLLPRWFWLFGFCYKLKFVYYLCEVVSGCLHKDYLKKKNRTTNAAKNSNLHKLYNFYKNI